MKAIATSLLERMFHISPEDCQLEDVIKDCTTELELFDAIRAMGEKHGLEHGRGGYIGDLELDAMRTVLLAQEAMGSGWVTLFPREEKKL